LKGGLCEEPGFTNNQSRRNGGAFLEPRRWVGKDRPQDRVPALKTVANIGAKGKKILWAEMTSFW